MDLDPTLVEELVARALSEDLDVRGDLSTELALGSDADRAGTAVLVAKAAGVVAGIALAERAFLQLDPACRVEIAMPDGSRVAVGDVVIRAHGRVGALLAAERTALNFLQRLSGIATATRALVDEVAGTSASIMDTRKTTPTLRSIEKFAVAVGGGVNHRNGLFDQVLLKENHFAWSSVSYEEVVARVVQSGRAGDAVVIAEARTIAEAEAVVRGGAGVVMLDNFQSPDELKAGVVAVRRVAAELGREVAIEASGGVTRATVRAVAETGVDRISVGAITHSAGSLDLSMLVEMEGARRTREFRTGPDRARMMALRADVRAQLEGWNLESAVIMRTILVVDELLGNSIDHGDEYRDPACELRLTLEAHDQALRIVFEDVDVPQEIARELSTRLAGATEMPPLDAERGRGMFLIGRNLEDVRFDWSEASGLRVTGFVRSESE